MSRFSVSLPLLGLAFIFVALGASRGPDPASHGADPFHGPDDRMRMLQVLDWHGGADWFDLTQERLNPPTGVAMHWSRLPDIPLRACYELLLPWLGEQAAVRWTAKLAPLGLGLIYFGVFVWAAAPLIAPAPVFVGGLLCLAVTVPHFSFAAGRIDHHGWQLILALVALGAVVRLAIRPAESVGAIMAAGVAGGLAFWVGAEGIPPVAFATAALCLLWCLGDRSAARALLRYGAALVLTVVALYPLALPAARWLEPACDAFSPLSVGLAAAVLGLGLGLRLAPETAPWTRRGYRFAFALLWGLTLLWWIGWLFPQCQSGGYANLPEASRHLVEQVQEAQPMAHVLRDTPDLAASVLPIPLFALVLLLVMLWRSAPERRGLWAALLVFCAGSLAVQGWQMRGSALANAYAGVILAAWVAAWARREAAARHGLLRVTRRLLPLLVISVLPLAVGLLARTASQASSAGAATAVDCPLDGALPWLNAQTRPDGTPLTIAAPVNMGASLLLWTGHQVLAAPYHRNAEGLAAQEAIFFGSKQEARQVLASRGVDLIVLCRPAGDGAAQPTGQSLADGLMRGESPAWIEPLRSFDNGLQVYRVRAASSTR